MSTASRTACTNCGAAGGWKWASGRGWRPSPRDATTAGERAIRRRRSALGEANAVLALVLGEQERAIRRREQRRALEGVVREASDAEARGDLELGAHLFRGVGDRVEQSLRQTQQLSLIHISEPTRLL